MKRLGILIFIGLACLVALAWYLIRRFGSKEGIQLTSTIVGTISTVVLGFFAWLQLDSQQRAERIQQTAYWGELRNCMWALMDQYPPKGSPGLLGLTPEERAAWFKKMRQLLDSQIGNPALLADETSLGHWRNAISTAKTGADLARDPAIVDDRLFMAWADGLQNDVTTVWKRLVLDSDQVSAVGGRPKP